MNRKAILAALRRAMGNFRETKNANPVSAEAGQMPARGEPFLTGRSIADDPIDALRAEDIARSRAARPTRTNNANPVSVVDNEFNPATRDVIGALRSMGIDDEGLSNAAYVAAQRAYKQDGMAGLKAWAASSPRPF